jgi:uncharacterized repeat protein (TIGR03803 family)
MRLLVVGIGREPIFQNSRFEEKSMKTRLVVIAVLFVLAGTAVAANAAERETVLYQFNHKSGGYGPQGPEVMDSAGNIYGVASEGGVAGQCCGLIYELSPKAGGGYSYNIIYTFTGVGADDYPVGTLTIDAAGNLYGTTDGGYTEIYKLSPNGSGGWTESVPYSGSASGFQFSAVAEDAVGNIYSTVAIGGANNEGFVLELSPSGTTWTAQDIYDFDGTHGAGGNGGFNVGGLILDAAGNLYGTTPQGGTSTNCTGGCGVLFKLRPDGSIWVESVLVNFNGANGSVPAATLSIDGSGNLYGTATKGGSKGAGLAFELTPNGTGGWTQHVLHAFSGDNGDGSSPDTQLILAGGAVYGTTRFGGNSGTVYKLTLTGGMWKESILHSFTGLKDGAFPGGVIIDANGNLFGEADFGGDSSNDGVTFELTAN